MPSLRATFISFLGVFAGVGGLALATQGADAIRSPTLSLALRGVAGRTIEVGEPLFVAVRVDAPDGLPESPVPKPASGSWRDATTVELWSEVGGIAVARGRVVPHGGETALNGEGEWALLGGWWFATEDVNHLTPGSYVVRADFQMRDGEGWKGKASAEPILINIVAPSGSPERIRQKTVSLALAAVAEGSPSRAAEILDEALRQDPDAIPLLVTRAQVALSVGDARAAAFCLRRARVLADARTGKPSIVLHELGIRIDQAMADPAVRDAPSAWEQLPTAVLEPVRSARTVAPAGNSSPISSTAMRGGQAGIVAAPPRASSPAPIAPSPKGSAAPLFAATPAPPASTMSMPRTPGVWVPPADIDDAKVRSDVAGQWAVSATAGTQYGKTQYSPAQATGAPNINIAGNSPDAWCPANKETGTDWLEVAFAKPVQASEVRVRQNDGVGAIIKIEAIASDGTTHVWWEGVDPYVAPATREIVWFAVRVPQTNYLVAKVKITLNLAAKPGWKEIDAVQLVGAMQ